MILRFAGHFLIDHELPWGLGKPLKHINQRPYHFNGKDRNGNKCYTGRSRGQGSEKVFMISQRSLFGIKLVDMVEIYPVLFLAV